MIHLRFSSVMNSTFVTLMYGTALPILYPIAMINFIVLFCIERLLVFYYYKQPPAFDMKMTMSTLSIMILAPIIYMAMSFWFLSNN